MSIRSEVKKLVEEGKLHLIEPADRVCRTMAVTPEIANLVNGPWLHKKMAARCIQLRIQLEAFVKGQVIGASLTPYGHGIAYMGRLDKPEDEVWDIRGRDPSPGLRVFGRFADLDLFVAFLCAPRSVRVDWLPREPLKDRTSLEWQFGILECQKQWDELLPKSSPVHGDSINDYIKENVILVEPRRARRGV